MQRPDGTFDSVPDPGLDEHYEYVRLLGYGGTGQTLLYRDRRTDELSAVKLIRRPLPEIIQQRLLREFTVRETFRHHEIAYRCLAAVVCRTCVPWEPCKCALGTVNTGAYFECSMFSQCALGTK